MRRRTAIATLAAAAVALPLLPITAAHAEPSTPPLGVHDRQTAIVSDTDTILVTFDRAQSDPSRAAADAIEEPASDVASATIRNISPITNKIVAVTLDQPLTQSEASAIGQQASDADGVKGAEPATTMTTGATNDSYYSSLWNLNGATSGSYGVNAESAWPTSTGAGTIVGVIDTGITAHPDLTGSATSIIGGNVIAGYDFISDTTYSADGDGRDPDPTDVGDYCLSDPNSNESTWHGTHVAGIIAAIRNNRLGVAGVAPDAKIEPLRVLGRCGGDEKDIIAAILWGAGVTVNGVPANPHPVSVLNLSLGGRASCSTAMQSAIDSAIAKGVPVVVAAGNKNEDVGTQTPANCKNVIRVVASTYEGARASYSNYGSSSVPATIAAPGGSGKSTSSINDWITSTWNAGTTTTGSPSYVGMVGTSMATPHIAGVAAMLKQIDPAMSPAKIQQYLTSTATALPSCSTTMCGAGVVNALRAVGTANAPIALTRLQKPAVTGTVMVGGKLTTAGGGVSGATYSYQWNRSGTPIGGATSNNYTLVAADAGTQLNVTVTASLFGSAATKTSDSVTVEANSVSNLAVPIIGGNPVVGGKLTTTGTGAGGATYTYQWYRSGTVISGATANSYTTSSYDLGKQISVGVTATLLGTTASHTSQPVTISANPVTNITAPVVGGLPVVGSKLTTTGAGANGATYTYQWYRSGTAISGATGASYTVGSSDLGKQISVRVTATLFGQHASKTSSPTAKVTAGKFSNSTLPYTTGTYKKGKTLKANAGSWSPKPSTVKYRWLRNGTSISGATKSSYKLGSKDKGKRISVRITVSRAGYVTTTVTTASHKIG